MLNGTEVNVYWNWVKLAEVYWSRVNVHQRCINVYWTPWGKRLLTRHCFSKRFHSCGKRLPSLVERLHKLSKRLLIIFTVYFSLSRLASHIFSLVFTIRLRLFLIFLMICIPLSISKCSSMILTKHRDDESVVALNKYMCVSRHV